MGSTGDSVELVEVIGHDAEVDQPLGELHQRVETIVHPAQQYRLVEQQYAGRRKSSQGRGHVRVEFGRVVGVNYHDRREPRGRDRCEQAGGDALGDYDGQSGVNSQAAQMWDVGESTDELGQVVVDQRERVAAAEDHLIDARVGGDLVDGRLPGGGRFGHLLVGKMSAETIAAVHGAGSGGHQQDATLVFLQQTGAERGRAVTRRVVAVARSVGQLCVERQNLPQQRIVRIAGPHALDVAVRSKERKIASAADRGGLDVRRQSQNLAELSRIADRVADGLLPRQVCVELATRRAGRAAIGCLSAWGRLENGPDRLAAGRYNGHVIIVGLVEIVGDGLGVGPPAYPAGPAKRKRKLSVASYNTSDFRKGIKVLLDGDPYLMIECNFVKPGKGSALYKCKLRNLFRNTVIDRTYKGGQSVEAADVTETAAQYLYRQGKTFVFMENETYEQYELSEGQVDEAWKYLKEGMECQMMLFNGNPVSVTPPKHVVLKIEYCEPAVRGNTATNVTKPVQLESGAEIQAPAFVESGTYIKVDTRTGEYIERAKEP